MKRINCIIVLAFVMAMAGGCASNSSKAFILQSVQQPAQQQANITGKALPEDKFNFLGQPINTIGLFETWAIYNERFRVYEVLVPMDLLYVEWRDDRIKWFGLAKNQRGAELQVQLILPPERDWRVRCMGNNKFLIGWLVVDGVPEDHVGAKAILFSTQLSRVISLRGDGLWTEVQRSKICKDPNLRAQLIEQFGVELSFLQPADYAVDVFNSWNRHEIEGGFILTPLKLSSAKEVAAINPAYSFSQKYEAHGWKKVSTDPVDAAATLVHDAVFTFWGKSNGWDFESDNPKNRKKREQVLNALISELNCSQQETRL